MKKTFAILAMAGFLAACNNSSDSTTTTTDSSSKMTNKTETQIADSIRMADTVNKRDSLKK